MNRIIVLKTIICLAFSPAFFSDCFGQLKFLVPKNSPDTGFIKTYNSQITARLFTVQKFNNFTLSGNSLNHHEHLRFYSNKSMGIGFGAVYKIFNFNISIGLPRIKKFELNYEKTRAIDLHTSMYGRKWVFDIYGQFYKGFYSYNLTNPFQSAHIERTDIIMNTVGLTAHYLTNNSRFSYRAFRINDEWQYKSSGTFLLSASAFAGQIHSNKNKGFISDEFYTSDRMRDVRKKFYLQFGPGGGYAYNFVWKKNYFLLTSASVRLLYDVSREFTPRNDMIEQGGFNWGYTLLSAIGYQNETWGVNASVINTFNTIESAVYSQSYRANVGYVKLTAMYRIPYGRFTKRITPPFDYLLKK